MHDIPNVEVARHKAKGTERKLEGIRTRGDKPLLTRKRDNVGTVKILGHPTINAIDLNHMPMKLKIGRSHLIVTLIIEKRKKHMSSML